MKSKKILKYVIVLGIWSIALILIRNFFETNSTTKNGLPYDDLSDPRSDSNDKPSIDRIQPEELVGDDGEKSMQPIESVEDNREEFEEPDKPEASTITKESDKTIEPVDLVKSEASYADGIENDDKSTTTTTETDIPEESNKIEDNENVTATNESTVSNSTETLPTGKSIDIYNATSVEGIDTPESNNTILDDQPDSENSDGGDTTHLNDKPAQSTATENSEAINLPVSTDNEAATAISEPTFANNTETTKSINLTLNATSPISDESQQNVEEFTEPEDDLKPNQPMLADDDITSTIENEDQLERPQSQTNATSSYVFAVNESTVIDSAGTLPESINILLNDTSPVEPVDPLKSKINISDVQAVKSETENLVDENTTAINDKLPQESQLNDEEFAEPQEDSKSDRPLLADDATSPIENEQSNEDMQKNATYNRSDEDQLERPQSQSNATSLDVFAVNESTVIDSAETLPTAESIDITLNATSPRETVDPLKSKIIISDVQPVKSETENSDDGNTTSLSEHQENQQNEEEFLEPQEDSKLDQPLLADDATSPIENEQLNEDMNENDTNERNNNLQEEGSRTNSTGKCRQER